MMDVRFRPLALWGHPETLPYQRRSSLTFKASWSNTLDLLDRELHYLRAKAVIIGSFHTEADIRLDGWPRADARMPTHPGIELSFDSVHGRLTYATDVCARWDHNVRSIALGLEALRAVDRYGCAMRGQQYAGWRALAAGPGENLPVTERDARKVIMQVAEVSAVTSDAISIALKRTHPDTGGDPDLFRRVQRAREILGAV